MSVKKVKMGIIGCGQIARVHVEGGCKILKQKGMDNFEIVSVCDLKRENAQKLASLIEEFQEKPEVYTDFKEMISKESLNATDICTDHRSHHLIAHHCFEEGLHVLCEKPLGITIKATRLMIETAKKTGRILAVAENYRRGLTSRAIHFAISKGYIGKPQMYFSGWIGGNSLWWGRDNAIAGTLWRHRKLEAGAGMVLDMGVHHADLMRYWLGEVDEVYAVTKSFAKVRFIRDSVGRILEKGPNTVEDAAFSIIKFKNGCTGIWTPAYSAGHGEGSSFGPWIYGEKGVIKESQVITDEGAKINLDNFFISRAPEEAKDLYFPSGITEDVALEIYDFIQAVLGAREVEADGLTGLKALAICYSVIESSHLNRPIKVKDVEEGKIEGYQREINESLGI